MNRLKFLEKAALYLNRCNLENKLMHERVVQAENCKSFVFIVPRPSYSLSLLRVDYACDDLEWLTGKIKRFASEKSLQTLMQIYFLLVSRLFDMLCN